jgi:DNA-binding transcriptional ArsR family regulator
MAKNRRSATEAEARALASAVRLRILRLCLDRALTNKEIAQKLGAHPATTLHHVRTLVATGFLAAQQERRGARGAREVPYLATGKSWTLDVEESGVSGGGRAILDAFLAEIRLVDYDEGGMARLGLRLSDDEVEELRQRMADLLNEYAERPRTPGGRPYSVFLAIYSDVSRDWPGPAGPAGPAGTDG